MRQRIHGVGISGLDVFTHGVWRELMVFAVARIHLALIYEEARRILFLSRRGCPYAMRHERAIKRLLGEYANE